MPFSHDPGSKGTHCFETRLWLELTEGGATGGRKLQTVLLSLEEKVMGETPQSLMAARLSRNMLRRKEELHFASDLFPSIFGKAKAQESCFFIYFFIKKK